MISPLIPPRAGLVLWLGWSLTPIWAFVNRYVFDDWQFLITLLVVIAVDSVLGTWNAWRTGTLSSRGMLRVLQKVAFYCLLLIAVHALATHRVRGQVNDLLAWLDGLTYATILAREFLSILEHSANLGIWQPPAWLVARLARVGQLPPSADLSPTPPHDQPPA